MSNPLCVLSLGAGVQSTTLALMASTSTGEMPPPTCAIFADTQAEPKGVYQHLDWLTTQLSFPIYRVTAGNLETAILNGTTTRRFASVPFYTTSDNKRGGMLRRQCTREYKVAPITKKLRELLRAVKYQRLPIGSVELWIGISLDEIIRMKPNRERWITNRWPLVERRMTRQGCITWLQTHGFPIPQKSACVFCPYHDNAFYREHKAKNSEEWQRAVNVDEAIRHGLPGVHQSAFVHRSLQPLAVAPLEKPNQGQQELFGNECEGMCGV